MHAVDEPALGVNTDAPMVELCIPADPAYVRIARLAAGDMAGRAGFSVDELDDVRLAVDEVCATLMGAGGRTLELRMQTRGRCLVIDGYSDRVRATIAPSELSEMLLRALVDSYRFHVGNGVREDGIGFELVKLAREIA